VTESSSPAPVPPALIALAERLADAARPIARRWFRTPMAVESKSDTSPVTRADREIEAAMRAILRDARPDDAVIGEEMGGAIQPRGHQWILDPIDGTSAFIAGAPMFGVLIALAVDGRFVLGVIDQPVTGERWMGAAGHPATLNGAPARVRACPDIAGALLYTTAPEFFAAPGAWPAFARVRARARFTRYGAECYAFGLLASGHVDLIVESQLALHDFAALVPVVEAAGGIITDWDGAALTSASDGRIVAAGDPACHAAALRLLAG